MKRRTQRLISASIAVLLLWWFLRSVDLAIVGQTLAEIQGGYLIGAVSLSLGTMVYRSWRWGYLVAPIGLVPMKSLVSCVFMGWAVTAVLPGRLGEMARPLLLGQKEGLGRMALFGTVVLERALDLLMVLLLLAIYLTFFPSAFSSGNDATRLNMALRSGGWLLLVSLVGSVLVVVVISRLSSITQARIRSVVDSIPGQIGQRGWALIVSFLKGIMSPLATDAPGLSRRRLAVLAVVHTLVLWAGICGVHVLLFRAFGLELSVGAVFPLISMVVVGLAVPLPAAVGSYHTAVLVGLTTLLNVPIDLAAGYAIVSHAVAFVPSTLIGLVLLAREGLTPGAFATRSG